MHSKYKKIALSVFIPAILLFITACPGLFVNYIEVSFFPFGAVVGATATFHCTSPIVSGNVDGFVWDFGDGSTGSGQTATHQFMSEGDFVVTCSIISGSSVYTYTTTVMITGGFGGAPIGSFIYWTENVGGGSKIYRCDISGSIPCGSRTLVADEGTSGVDSASDIEIDGNFLYWSNVGSDEILRCDISGALPCTSELVIAALRPGSIDIDSTLLYYEHDSIDGERVRRCDISGALPCSSSLVAEEGTLNADFRSPIQAEDGLLSWKQESNLVSACSISGSIPCLFRSNLIDFFSSKAKNVQGYERQGPFIIWSNNGTDELLGCNVNGSQACMFTTVVANSSTSSVNDPEQVVWLGTTLYWKQNNSIRRCDVLSSLPCTSSLVLNSNSVGTQVFLGTFAVAP